MKLICFNPFTILCGQITANRTNTTDTLQYDDGKCDYNAMSVAQQGCKRKITVLYRQYGDLLPFVETLLHVLLVLSLNAACFVRILRVLVGRKVFFVFFIFS